MSQAFLSSVDTLDKVSTQHSRDPVLHPRISNRPRSRWRSLSYYRNAGPSHPCYSIHAPHPQPEPSNEHGPLAKDQDPSQNSHPGSAKRSRVGFVRSITAATGKEIQKTVSWRYGERLDVAWEGYGEVELVGVGRVGWVGWLSVRYVVGVGGGVGGMVTWPDG